MSMFSPLKQMKHQLSVVNYFQLKLSKMVNYIVYCNQLFPTSLYVHVIQVLLRSFVMCILSVTCIFIIVHVHVDVL